MSTEELSYPQPEVSDMPTETRSSIVGLPRGLAALALAAGIAFAGADVANADVERCKADWNDAAAEDYCPDAVVAYEAGAAGPDKYCHITASCSVTFDYGTKGNTSSTTLSYALNAFVNDADDLVLCIDKSSLDGEVIFHPAARLSNCSLGEVSAKKVVDGHYVTEP